MDEYLDAKCLLFRYCKTGLVNRDCRYADRVIAKAGCEILTYSIEGETDIKAANLVYLPGGVRFDMVSPWYERNFSVNIPVDLTSTTRQQQQRVRPGWHARGRGRPGLKVQARQGRARNGRL